MRLRMLLLLPMSVVFLTYWDLFLVIMHFYILPLCIPSYLLREYYTSKRDDILFTYYFMWLL